MSGPSSRGRRNRRAPVSCSGIGSELMRRGSRVVVMTTVVATITVRRFRAPKSQPCPRRRSQGALQSAAWSPSESSRSALSPRWPSCVASPTCGRGFGGYPSFLVMIAASPRAYSLAAARTECGARPRQSHARARVAKIAASLRSPSSPRRIPRIVFTVTSASEAAALSKDYTPPGADGPIRLLVFGGSQGARSLSDWFLLR